MHIDSNVYSLHKIDPPDRGGSGSGIDDDDDDDVDEDINGENDKHIFYNFVQHLSTAHWSIY